jgi:hypothetical protein
VRGEHSRQALAELRANVSWDRYDLDLEVRELASALEDAYGTARRPLGHSQDEIVQASIERRQEAERHAASARDEVERFVRNADVSRSSADAYLKDLSEWQDMVRNESLQVECHKNFAPVGPPLGWTLRKSNQALMRCMLIRREFSGGVQNRLFPTPPNWPSIWLLRYSGVYNVEPRAKSLGKEPQAPR